MAKKIKLSNPASALKKVPTGITGLDEITFGGLPLDRPTLVAGGSGCGKTLLGAEFLARGALEYDEPGVFVSFEESAKEIIKNTQSLGFNFESLIKKKKIHIEEIIIDPRELKEVGEYNLDALFIRLNQAIKKVSAKRIVLDTVETLFTNFSNQVIVRAELNRLFRWLKEKKVTAVITGEKGIDTLTRYGLEEYVVDCVIFLDNRISEQICTRRLRVVKYRGSLHGSNEYPFIITETGIFVMPITSVNLDYLVTNARISTGIPRLDTMLGKQGFYKGSSILVSGAAGTGKTNFAATFVDAACKRNERCIYFAFEESPDQLIRNLSSINIHLKQWEKKNLLKFYAVRPASQGLEKHLLTMEKMITEFKPSVIVIDPITNLISIGNTQEVKSMLARLIDFLKMRQITAYFTCLVGGVNVESNASNEMGVSSLMDTWIVLETMDINGEQNKTLRILKSRGMGHSNQIREVVISDKGLALKEVYTGSGDVLLGTARYNQEAKDRMQKVLLEQEFKRKSRLIERKRAMTESKIAALKAELDAEEIDHQQFNLQHNLQQETQRQGFVDMALARSADKSNSKRKK